MPPKRTPLPRSGVREGVHPMHHHRPVVTLAIGLCIILAIGAAALASGRVRSTIFNSENKGQAINIDTSDWVEYKSTDSPLAFRRPPTWQVEKKAAGEDTFLTLKVNGEEGTRTSIYISKSGYLGFEGLPQTEMEMDGVKGVRVSDALAGFKYNDLYYTFDAGLRADSTPIFGEILKSVRFD